MNTYQGLRQRAMIDANNIVILYIFKIKMSKCYQLYRSLTLLFNLQRILNDSI